MKSHLPTTRAARTTRATLAATATLATALAAPHALASDIPQPATSNPHSPRPNILVILCDQLSAWPLGCYGGKEIGTPNIDSLAREGTLITGFYASTPLCSPSRGSLMTGLYPTEDGVPKNDVQIRQDVSTWAQVFRDAGYDTGYAGKWHLDGSPQRPGWGIQGKDMGWTDHRYLYCFGHPKTITLVPGQQYPDTSNAVATDPAQYSTDFFTNRTLDYLAAHQAKRPDTPFCYMLSIPDPHTAYIVRAPYNTMYPPSTMKLPKTLTEPPKSDYYLYTQNSPNSDDDGAPAAKGGKKGKASGKKNTDSPDPKTNRANKTNYDLMVKNLPQIKSQYYGMIKCIDDNIGRVIQYLKQQNLYDNTIIVLTADHGDMMGEHAHLGKGVPFESAARVPMIIRYPAKIKPGLITDRIASSIDFYPTLLSLAGVPQTVKVSGKNMAPLLESKPEPWADEVFTRYTGRGTGWLSVVTKDYKLIYGEADGGQKALLIDRKNDPDESYNQFDNPAFASAIKTLNADLLAYCKAHNDPHLKWVEKRLK